MKILFYQWHSFMNKGMERALEQLQMEYDVLFYQQTDWEKDACFQELSRAVLRRETDKAEQLLSGIKGNPMPFYKRRSQSPGGYDVVLSVNFSPILSNVCEELGVRYVSWIYDSPVNIRDLTPMKNTCNDIYMFDRGMAEEFQKLGIAAKHMPLAVDVDVFGQAIRSHRGELPKYRAQVSLVGNLYQTEYAYMTSPMTPYDKGYLEGVISAQTKVYGGYLISELVTEELLERMNRQYSRVASDGFQMGRRELEFLLASEVTGRERYTIAALLSNHYDFALYSMSRDERLKKARVHGYVDYYTEMPLVFSQSRINLNISLRTIRTGIPLRVVDVLGCGGFLISNYQSELEEYFKLGQDLEVYGSIEELYEKVQFYLEHEDVRRQIAQNGFEKVKRDFTFTERLAGMLQRSS